MTREYLNDGAIQCSMMSSLHCDEAIDGPRVIGTLGNGQYDVATANTFSKVAKELGLTVRMIKPGKKTDLGNIVDKGFRGIYIGYYNSDQITAFWNRVSELESQANS